MSGAIQSGCIYRLGLRRPAVGTLAGTGGHTCVTGQQWTAGLGRRWGDKRQGGGSICSASKVFSSEIAGKGFLPVTPNPDMFRHETLSKAEGEVNQSEGKESEYNSLETGLTNGAFPLALLSSARLDSV